MSVPLLQVRTADGRRRVGAIGADGTARLGPRAEAVLQLAQTALAAGETHAREPDRDVRVTRL